MKDEAIKKLLEYLEQTKDFVFEQAPDLFKEILRFDTISCYLGSIICFLILSVGCYLSIKFLNVEYQKSLERPALHMIVWIATASITLPFCAVIFSNINDLIQIKVAPKYYLIQKIKKI